MKRETNPRKRTSPVARSRLWDTEQRLERKKRLLSRHARDGRAHGLVELLGPLHAELQDELRQIVAQVEERERRSDQNAQVLAISPFEEGLVVETTTEKLAQHIADALARSRGASVERLFDDEGARRILICALAAGS